MKKNLIILLCFTGFEAFAQQNKIDSLQSLLKKDREDTSKVNHLNALAWELKSNNPDTAIIIGNQALSLAEKYQWKKGIANSLAQLGAFYGFKGDYTKALDYYLKALKIDEEVNNKKGIASCLGSIGLIYYYQGDYPKALGHNFKALKMAQEMGDKKLQASNLGYIGNVYKDQGDFPKALDYYFKALKIAEELGDKRLQSTNIGGIGIVYEQQGDYPKALAYQQKALKIQEEQNNKRAIAATLHNIGNLYSKQGDQTQALEYYFRALKINEEIGNKSYKANNLTCMGAVYYAQGDYPKALDYYFKSLKMDEELGDKSGIATCLVNFGELYTKNGKFNEAEVELKKAITLADSIGSKDILRDAEEYLSHLYDTTGKFELALAHYKKAMVLKDTLFSQEKNKEITRKEMNYEFDKKEAATKAEQDKKDVLTQAAMRQQRNIRNSVSAGLAIVLLFSVIVFRQRNKISKEKKRSDDLLLNILPSETAEELKQTGGAKAKSYDEVTVMFTDFKNFTQAAEKFSAEELVNEINDYFSEFDKIISKYNIEKIKTIGDSYMCAGGLPVANQTNAEDIVRAALDIQQLMQQHRQQREQQSQPFFEIRIGVHTGPVVAGIVGIKKFAYDIWGDTVNIASRMESSGEAGKVNISGSTYELEKEKFPCSYRGKIQAKNKGEIDMYFVEAII
ncbi:MAG TPA: adenylate/guanylate cyclase domain-containing protein [Chitinophagales bacterium]|nr:adenylate/guanylate cyclase domain-containing protein [Chitinophagales bacterium]